MKREDFWFNVEAEEVGAIPTGVKAGQFLFLSAQTPVDLSTGKIIRDLIDLPAETKEKLAVSQAIHANFGPIMAQTWQIYHNLIQILAKQNASLKDIVRQHIFVPHLKDMSWMEKVMLSFFPDEKPATLILGVPDRGLHHDIRVWVDAIVLVPQSGGLEKETIYLPELEKVTAPYPQAVKVGQLLFFEGYTGIDLKSGRPVTTLEELDAEAKEVRLEGRFENATSEARRCQLWLILKSHLKKLLEGQGTHIDDCLVMQWFSRHDMWDYCNVEYLRARIFKSPVPLGFGTTVHNLSIIPEVESICGGIALLPGKYKKELYHYANNQVVTLTPYACVSRSGPFAHGGGMGLNIPEKRSYVAFSDLADNGRFQVGSRIDCNHPMMTKVWHIYKSAFAKAGVGPDQVIHQTFYLENPGEWPAIESIARIIFNGHIPATTIIPVDDIAFYWHYNMDVPESIGGERIEAQFQYLTP